MSHDTLQDRALTSLSSPLRQHNFVFSTLFSGRCPYDPVVSCGWLGQVRVLNRQMVSCFECFSMFFMPVFLHCLVSSTCLEACFCLNAMSGTSKACPLSNPLVILCPLDCVEFWLWIPGHAQALMLWVLQSFSHCNPSDCCY